MKNRAIIWKGPSSWIPGTGVRMLCWGRSITGWGMRNEGRDIRGRRAKLWGARAILVHGPEVRRRISIAVPVRLALLPAAL